MVKQAKTEGNNVIICTRVSKGVYNLLEEHCKKFKISKSKFVRGALFFALNKEV